VSLAESFLLNGIANFIGTYWPVSDSAASRFANAFYGGLLAGKSLSLAMREARQAAKAVSPRDWANYMHFGDPLYVMRHAQPCDGQASDSALGLRTPSQPSVRSDANGPSKDFHSADAAGFADKINCGSASRCASFSLPRVLPLRRPLSGSHAMAAIATDGGYVDERAA